VMMIRLILTTVVNSTGPRRIAMEVRDIMSWPGTSQQDQG
jgi:hypothetical protein